ncbi:GNAT family N-acetyltransferase [Streptomyces sp. A7024]|uniref:GNAT family N-acetyltransferase n=1 Tax=Streptomyces coryli TaxID=1128680 RepID=A0A6G4UE97_9ACTN|nr:GNAT family N-acetyltransferase [Streptomyces coryli]
MIESDLEIFLRHEHDPENVKRSHFKPRDRDHFMTHWHTKVLGVPGNFVQTALADGEVAGGAVAWTQDGQRFLGYVFGREFWGRGIGTRTVRLFLEREQTRPLYADPYIGNTGSWKLLERLGFEREGTEAYGEDEHVMYVLR